MDQNRFPDSLKLTPDRVAALPTLERARIEGLKVVRDILSRQDGDRATELRRLLERKDLPGVVRRAANAGLERLR